jgi:hypothetical protein
VRCVFGSPCGFLLLALFSALSSLGLLRCCIRIHVTTRSC